MTEQSSAPDANDPDQLREEIERTRAEMSATVDAIADKVNVKAKAEEKVADVKQKVVDSAALAKQSAPAPVQSALDKAGPVAHQVSAKVGPHRNKVFLGAAGAVLLLLVVRRRRHE